MVRIGYTGYNGAVSVGGQASDGMRLSRDNGTVATTAKDLESASAFRKRVIEDLKSFEELRNAPVVLRRGLPRPRPLQWRRLRRRLQPSLRPQR